MKKSISFIALILSSLPFLTLLKAQKHVLNDVLKAEMSGTGHILSDGTISGYYSFYEYDKKGSKTSTYRIDIFDQNLTPLSKKTFSATEDMVAKEAAYNGQNLIIKLEDFKNRKEKKYVFKIFDKNAEIINTTTKEARRYDYAIGGEEDGENKTLFPVPNKGFVNYSIGTKKGALSKTQYFVEYIPQVKEEKGWTVSSKANSEDYETATFLGVNDKIILSLVQKRSKLMSRDLNESVMGIDIATGERLFDRSIEDKKYAATILDAVIDEETGDFILMGNYFEKDAKTMKAKSLGFCAFHMDSTGHIYKRKYISWEKDVERLVKKNKKNKDEEIGQLYFHKFIKTSDGRFFGIGEQYHMAASGAGIIAGIAASALRSGTITANSNMSVRKAVVEDIVIFEFDNSFGLKDIKIFDKTKNNVQMPKGTEFWSPRIIAYMMKHAWGGFDYQFTQIAKDKSKFTVGYLDYEKSDDMKGYIFGSINYSDSKFNTDKIKISSKASWFSTYPGKEGYIMISEYFRKEKKLEFRMEKVNF